MKKICSVCGAEYDPTHWMRDIAEKLDSKKVCFDCNFWLEHAELDKGINKNTYVIVSHKHYIIESESSSNTFRGFGGAPFYIKFTDDRIVKTTNLWYQGEIPERFWNVMVDNAVFLTENEYNKLMGISVVKQEFFPF